MFLLHALLTHEECDQMIAMARPELEASTVVDVATGQGVLSQVRLVAQPHCFFSDTMLCTSR